MKHRRRKAMRFDELLWITKELVAQVGFVSNKYNPSRSRVFLHVLALELPRLSK